MAELADAHGSGPCEGYFMEVRVLLPAPFKDVTFDTNSEAQNPLNQGDFVVFACCDDEK